MEGYLIYNTKIDFIR